MARLILTFDDSAAGALKGTGFADCVIAFAHWFVWGQLEARDALKALLAQRPARDVYERWAEDLKGRLLDAAEARRLDFAEFCEGFDAIELWADPEPNAQLQLV